ncbi:solute carrier family 52, riboflavin transporter, member 3 isoform X2 [Leguminivora glycinivorella]|uniref:solute carrier family 52, riboflavin transporter, member 3 isoform X2 n=1 Tax=Leguminivora glycinivorella TaxID=1035111 RepID=UPI00200BFCA5|nr:solute carrier family 52, riboflavin transporter, member 3 isoform X2 [Leguminivora glycinivorella]
MSDGLNEDRERIPCLSSDSDRTMWGTQRRVLLDVLLACWGVGTWLGVNGLYVQLPLLVERLPEGWALPSSMVLAIQLANLGLVAYAIMRRFRPNASDSPYIYGLLVVGTLALALNAFLYDQTVGNRSVAFLLLTFFAALVGCTSSVLFYPYLRHFRDVYLATYLVGEGLSGFIPAILALIQGVGGDPTCVLNDEGTEMYPIYSPPRFDSTVFLMLLAGLSAMSLASFVIVDLYKGFASERVEPAAAEKDDEATSEPVALHRGSWLSVLVLMGVLNALSNGVLPSVQSYSCIPYGNLAYHLSVTLGSMANPAACLAGVWLAPLPSRVLAGVLTAAAVPLAYIMATALMSPEPPLYQNVGGAVLIIASWTVVSAIISYARMWVYGWARRGGARGMRATGVATQVGSSLGSVVLYFIVNYTAVFTQPPACPPVS